MLSDLSKVTQSVAKLDANPGHLTSEPRLSYCASEILP